MTTKELRNAQLDYILSGTDSGIFQVSQRVIWFLRISGTTTKNMFFVFDFIHIHSNISDVSLQPLGHLTIYVENS